MPNQTEYLDLIVQYLNNPQDEKLHAAVKTFCAESASNESYFNEIVRVWDLSAKSNLVDEINFDHVMINFKNALQDKLPVHKSNSKWWIGIAATFLVAALGYWAYDTNKPEIFITLETKNLQDSVLLADGSKIILAKNTVVRYPKLFTKKSRIVYLTRGRAFFEIAKDPKHPFSVLMGESSVNVLGTSFNLDFSENNIALDVATGRVLFSPYKDATSSILKAGQALTYSIFEKQFTTRISQNATAWHTKELVFEDTPLIDVCKQLSDYFQINIILEDKQIFTQKFNATFKDDELEQVLSILKETYNLKIRRTEKKITLKTN